MASLLNIPVHNGGDYLDHKKRIEEWFGNTSIFPESGKAKSQPATAMKWFPEMPEMHMIAHI